MGDVQRTNVFRSSAETPITAVLARSAPEKHQRKVSQTPASMSSARATRTADLSKTASTTNAWKSIVLTSPTAATKNFANLPCVLSRNAETTNTAPISSKTPVLKDTSASSRLVSTSNVPTSATVEIMSSATRPRTLASRHNVSDMLLAKPMLHKNAVMASASALEMNA